MNEIASPGDLATLMTAPDFHGLLVLALESRRASELATIVSRLGGRPIVAPALREVPLESQAEARACVEAIARGEVDVVILLTGVGTRALLAIADDAGRREAFVAGLGRTRVVARGPKPMAVLREIGVPAWILVREPNTWRELVAALDARAGEFNLAGARVVVQEYGAPSPELSAALVERGAQVVAAPVYRWELPEDLEPLRAAVAAIERGEVDVLVLTSGVQFAHLWRVAGEQGAEQTLARALPRLVIASIGPTTSSEIRRRGFVPDIEASQPRMGMLVTEAAARAGALLEAKRR